MIMKYCKKCILPSTRPNIQLDKNGVCCERVIQKKTINWDERLDSLKKIIKQIKSKNATYDCVIPVSGGKDEDARSEHRHQPCTPNQRFILVPEEMQQDWLEWRWFAHAIPSGETNCSLGGSETANPRQRGTGLREKRDGKILEGDAFPTLGRTRNFL